MNVERLGILGFATILSLGCAGSGQKPPAAEETDLISFSRIDGAWEYGRGSGATVAILDWQFDLRGKAAEKYVDPVSMVPGEAIGKLKPWHGEWMAEIVHRIAPDARIIPIKARGLESDDYQDYVTRGIRYAADKGAVAVTSSMGPLEHTEELVSAVEYAESRGTVFINVHPEYIPDDDGNPRLCRLGECNEKIIHTGVVSVPDHPTEPESNRDVYVWPYDLVPKYEDGWGYSNGPPIVAGVIALMRGAYPGLTPADARRAIRETAVDRDGFSVLDAEAAVRAVASE